MKKVEHSLLFFIILYYQKIFLDQSNLATEEAATREPDENYKNSKPDFSPDSDADTESDQLDGMNTLIQEEDGSHSESSLQHRGSAKPRMRICFDSDQV